MRRVNDNSAERLSSGPTSRAACFASLPSAATLVARRPSGLRRARVSPTRASGAAARQSPLAVKRGLPFRRGSKRQGLTGTTNPSKKAPAAMASRIKTERRR